MANFLQFRKKPVVVQAMQWCGSNSHGLNKFCGLNWGRADAHDIPWQGKDDGQQLIIWNSLENQWICCPVNHWIIRGADGELYPCDPNVFEATYEKVES